MAFIMSDGRRYVTFNVMDEMVACAAVRKRRAMENKEEEEMTTKRE